MAIKVFVVVTDWHWPQVDQSGGVPSVSIDFPKTVDFLVPGDPDMQEAEPFWGEDHTPLARIAKLCKSELQ
jgi:hypothetical protein